MNLEDPPTHPIPPSAKAGFLLLVCSQALHSVEEWWFSLWEVWSPARIVSAVISDNLAVGFAVANTAIVLFGFWCYLSPVRRSWQSAGTVMWGWVVVELINGVVHSLLAVDAQGYFPGVLTAPLLIAAAAYTGARLVATRRAAAR